MAVASVPLANPCPDCAGTGSINDAVCYSCEGDRVARRRRRWSWRKPARRALEGLATPAGMLVGQLTRVPGIGGAAAVSYGAAWTAHSVWHPLPLWGVALVLGGVFGILADRRL